MRTSLRSSDDEVSKFIIFDRESIILENQCLNALPLRGPTLISHAWNGYIIVPRVMGFITVVEVMIFELTFYKQL